MAKRVDNGIVYTPPGLAEALAARVGTVCDTLDWRPHAIMDPCCGDGALWRAGCAQFRLPAVCAFGWDLTNRATDFPNAQTRDLFDANGATWPGEAVWLLNPPYVGRSNLTRIVGKPRVDWLKKIYKTPKAGSCDLAGYVLRHILATYRPKIMGVLATNTIFQGATRRVGTHWAVRNGYLIVDVSDNIAWEGAAVTVRLFTLADARAFGLPEMEIV